jgi:hypothetical protein
MWTPDGGNGGRSSLQRHHGERSAKSRTRTGTGMAESRSADQSACSGLIFGYVASGAWLHDEDAAELAMAPPLRTMPVAGRYCPRGLPRFTLL